MTILDNLVVYCITALLWNHRQKKLYDLCNQTYPMINY